MRRVPQRGGFWQGVSGGANEDEELLQAAKREVTEETALVPKFIKAVGYSYTFPVETERKYMYAPDVSHIEEHVFVAFVEGNDPTMSDELDMWKWVGFGTGLKLLKWPENKGALRRCRDFLLAHQTEFDEENRTKVR
jgi:8-oxo-dGTP pyrophosphatase MutT (NUDIX family)